MEEFLDLTLSDLGDDDVAAASTPNPTPTPDGECASSACSTSKNYYVHQNFTDPCYYFRYPQSIHSSKQQNAQSCWLRLFLRDFKSSYKHVYKWENLLDHHPLWNWRDQHNHWPLLSWRDQCGLSQSPPTAELEGSMGPPSQSPPTAELEGSTPPFQSPPTAEATPPSQPPPTAELEGSTPPSQSPATIEVQGQPDSSTVKRKYHTRSRGAAPSVSVKETHCIKTLQN